ncbi:uncharacterized protein F5891DRAFT_1197568 [Suillus fuscotomentosus]|uniref:Protein kinase domain-containing protein n=1 Tax=Suillus fuscotomentosus TaxID=1912939 RepID=A0AAD4HEI8_9AGAM|nr:uncharacterized protein F5891DRAFT_1197568 [Suillus fuscotomentosus]KAG1891659.1 hypothetical protein F5891DRAFT_1197568 [Suillus fuscotomentosus]
MYLSKRELIIAFHDFVVAHKVMVQRNVLHRDLSPNNFIISNGRSYFIDFDHAQIIMEGNTGVHSQGTGTVPYISIRLLYAATVIERANGKQTDLQMEQWGQAIEDMGTVTLRLALGTYLVIIMFYIPQHTSDLLKSSACLSESSEGRLSNSEAFLAFPILGTMSCPCLFDFTGAFFTWLSVIDYV